MLVPFLYAVSLLLFLADSLGLGALVGSPLWDCFLNDVSPGGYLLLLVAPVLFLVYLRLCMLMPDTSPRWRIVISLDRATTSSRAATGSTSTSELSQLASSLAASVTQLATRKAAEITGMGKELADELYLHGGEPALTGHVAALVERELGALKALDHEAGRALTKLLERSLWPTSDLREQVRRRRTWP